MPIFAKMAEASDLGSLTKFETQTWPSTELSSKANRAMPAAAKPSTPKPNQPIATTNTATPAIRPSGREAPPEG